MFIELWLRRQRRRGPNVTDVTNLPSALLLGEHESLSTLRVTLAGLHTHVQLAAIIQPHRMRYTLNRSTRCRFGAVAV